MRPAARARGGPGGLPRRADSRAGRGAGCLPPDQGVRPAMVQRAEVRKDAQGRRGGVRPLLTRCSPRVPGREQTSRRCRPFLGPAAGLSALRGGPRWVRRRGTCGFIFACGLWCARGGVGCGARWVSRARSTARPAQSFLVSGQKGLNTKAVSKGVCTCHSSKALYHRITHTLTHCVIDTFDTTHKLIFSSSVTCVSKKSKEERREPRHVSLCRSRGACSRGSGFLCAREQTVRASVPRPASFLV